MGPWRNQTYLSKILCRLQHLFRNDGKVESLLDEWNLDTYISLNISKKKKNDKEFLKPRKKKAADDKITW